MARKVFTEGELNLLRRGGMPSFPAASIQLHRQASLRLIPVDAHGLITDEMLTQAYHEVWWSYLVSSTLLNMDSVIAAIYRDFLNSGPPSFEAGDDAE